MKRRHFRLLSITLVLVMTMAFVFPAGSKLSPIQVAEAGADPKILKETYVENGNRIVDEYGVTTYNGKRIPYRVVKITPISNASQLVASNTLGIGHQSIQGSASGKTASLNVIDIRAKRKEVYSSELLNYNLFSQTLYSAFSNVSGIPSGFNTSTYISNAESTVQVIAKRSIVVVFMYWNGTWKQVYRSESVSCQWGYGATLILNGNSVYAASKQGTSSYGSTSYNLSTCSRYLVNGKSMGYMIPSIEIKTLGKTFTLSYREVTANLEGLGMHRF